MKLIKTTLGPNLRAVLIACMVLLVSVLVLAGTMAAAAPSLSVSKTVDVSTISKGDIVKYTATFSNGTPSAVLLATVSDTLPSGFRFLTMVAPTDVWDAPSGETGTIVWTGPYTVPATGTLDFVYSVLANATASDQPYTNRVQGLEQGGEATSTASADVTVVAPNVVVAKQVTPTQVVEQSPVTYTVYISNTGNATGTINTIQDLLPTGFTFQQILFPNWMANPAGATGLVTWNGPFQVAAGSTFTMSYRVQAGTNSLTPYVNTVTATLDTGESPSGHAQVIVQPSVFMAYLPIITKPNPPPPADKLVFDARQGSSDWEIYTVKTDASELTMLTNNSTGDWDPSWSADGRKIIFASYRDNNQEIYTMNADGSNQVNVTSNSLSDDEPRWSPTNNQIAYQTRRSNIQGGQYSEIFTANPDGTGTNNVSHSLWSDWDPHYSPDGSRIAYVGALTIYANIWVVNANGSGQLFLTNNEPKHDRAPSWSPDGSRVIFISADWDKPNNRFKPDTAEIWVASADGTSLLRLTNNSAGDLAPNWSPDGTKIVFSSNRGGKYDIWVMGADGSNPQRLTDSSGGNYTPLWSPDGSEIAFISYRDGNEKRLFVMNADGSNQHKVSGDLRDVVHFSWIPQGSSSTGQANLLDTFGLPDSLANVSKAEFWLSQVPH